MLPSPRRHKAPTGEERGGGISWHPPAYSLFNRSFFSRIGFGLVQLEATLLETEIEYAANWP